MDLQNILNHIQEHDKNIKRVENKFIQNMSNVHRTYHHKYHDLHKQSETRLNLIQILRAWIKSHDSDKDKQFVKSIIHAIENATFYTNGEIDERKLNETATQINSIISSDKTYTVQRVKKILTGVIPFEIFEKFGEKQITLLQEIQTLLDNTQSGGQNVYKLTVYY